MSASTVARWNSIPMDREPDDELSNKRSRSDDDDHSSEDNISLVSRSPSPDPDRDVEMKDVYGYDEHVRGVAQEVITVETKIKNTNKGFSMLAKMGWTEGTPLGLSGNGRVDPLPFAVKQDSTGLGKVTQDFRMIETTVSQRRNLDSERMRFETAEQRQQREASVAQRAAVRSEISNALRPFYCELCDKQFQNVAQYDEHTNSYAHHHKARARDINANHPLRAGGREEAERRKEKERKREEKELRKLAKAAGIKLSAPPVVPSSQSGEGKGFKKPGWASVGDGSATLAPGTPGPPSHMPSSSSGWASVSGPPAPHVPPPPPPPSAPAPPSPGFPHQCFRSGGWSTLATSMEGSSSETSSKGGWTDVNSPVPPPPSSAPSDPAPPPPAESSRPPPPSGVPPPVVSSWSRLPPTPTPATPGHWAVESGKAGLSSGSLAPPPVQSQPSTPNLPGSDPGSNRKSKSKTKSKMNIDEEATAQSRGNWQNFQKMRGRR